MEEFESEAERLFDSIDGWIDLGNFKEAAEELNQLPSRFKSTIHFVKAWIRIYVAQEAWSNVQSMCQTLVRHAPNDPSGFLQLAEAFHKQGNRAGAISTLKDRLFGDDDSASSNIRYHLARYLCAAGDFDQSRIHLRAAMELDPSLRRKALDDPSFEKLWLNNQKGL